MTEILQRVETTTQTRRTRIRVYHEFLNFSDSHDGSSSEDEDFVNIGGGGILGSGGSSTTSQSIVPIDPVSTMATAAYEPDENSISLVQAVTGGASRDRVIKALQKANGNADMAVNYLFEA